METFKAFFGGLDKILTLFASRRDERLPSDIVLPEGLEYLDLSGGNASVETPPSAE